ncbi:M50 family metallopeptidase [Paenibacillus thermotolerans]|uniref:M50 family metallopeptidase n=1 Tax=Paenibacillus thermotolerans TaxID=3027807 RepID=UPI002368AF77|nr:MULTISPECIES: M50 family metallopeptidase [unclassified Paenibacillus]
MGRWIVTLAFLVGSFALTQWLPFSSYFKNVDTMIHEFGHAAATLVLSGDVMYIHLYEDHSGVTQSAVQEGWQVIPVALSGYIAASFFTVLLFYLHHKSRYRTGLFIVTAVAAASLLLFVRNDYGAQWLLGFLGLNAVAFLLPIGPVRTAYYLLIAFLTLVESVLSALTVMLLSWNDAKAAGDAANLAGATGVPAIVWGVLFFLIAMWSAKKAIGFFVPSSKKRKQDRAFPM